MARKHVADAALKKPSPELEKRERTLRGFAVDPLACADLVQHTREPLLAQPSHLRRQELELHTLERAFEQGRKYLTPEERAVLEDDPDLEYDLALLNDARTRDLPPRCREVLRLYRAKRLSPAKIARRLKITVETVERDLVCAMQGVARVMKRVRQRRSRRARKT